MDSKGFQSVGTWKRYKLGQARFTHWLKQTASKFKPSNPSTAPPAGNDTPKSKRLEPDSASDKVHWTELESLAEIVATNSKPEEIPWDPILVLRDVVALRKKSARFYSKTAEEDTTGKLKASNQKHEHIIKVLEKVLGVLEKAVSPTRSKEKKKKGPSEEHQRFSMDALDNMFNLLQLQRTGKASKDSKTDKSGEARPGQQPESEASESESESEAGAEHESKPRPGRNKVRQAKKKGKGGKKGKKTTRPKAGAKKTASTADSGADGEWVDQFQINDSLDDDDDDDVDYYMLIYCFFEDFNAIRNYVCERWCDYYYDKSVSLDTLAVITNAAAELFREMEKELLRLLRENGMQEFQTYDAMMKLLFFDYGMEHVDYDEEPETKEELHESIWRNEADWLGWSAYVAIEDILAQSPPGKVALFPPSAKKPPEYGPVTAEQFSRFSRACVFDLFPEVAETKALKKNKQEPPVIPGQPELELDFEQVLLMRYYPSCFIFSLQLYLDIRNILDDQVKDARRQLQATATAAIENMKKSMRSCDEVWHSEWREMAEHHIETLRHFALSDFTYEDKTLRARNMGVTERLRKYELFDNEPVWPGLMGFRTKLDMTTLSVRLLTRTPAPLWTGVLYHVTKRDYPDMPAWSEMDRFLDVHGSELLGFPVTESIKAADILVKHSNTMSDGKRYHVWMELLEKVGRITDFWYRYGDRAYNWRKRQDMNYVSDIVRGHFGLPPNSKQDPFGMPREKTPLKPESSCDDQRTQEMVRQIQMMGNMRHVEVLEILDETVETMTRKEFAVKYFKLDWEVQAFVEKLQKSMLELGLLSSPEDGVEKYAEKSDGAELLGRAIQKAILGAADQPFVSRMAVPPKEELDDRWSDTEEEVIDELDDIDGM